MSGSALAWLRHRLRFGASPRVRYVKVETGNAMQLVGRIKFALAGSMIKLDYEKDGQGQYISHRIVAETIPVESNGLYALVPIDGWFFSTHLSVTFLPDTRLVTQIGIEVEDHRVKVIKALGAVASLAVAMSPVATLSLAPTALLNVFEGPEKAPEPRKICPVLPVVIDVQECVRKAAQGVTLRELPGNPGWKYQMDLKPLPPDVVPVEAFINEFFEPGTSAWIHAAGRQATLTMVPPPAEDGGESICDQPPGVEKERSSWEDKRLVFALIVNDPSHVHSLDLPAKGNIKMHPRCGANLDSQGSGVSQGWDAVAEAAAQVKTVWEAQKAEKAKQAELEKKEKEEKARAEREKARPSNPDKPVQA